MTRPVDYLQQIHHVIIVPGHHVRRGHEADAYTHFANRLRGKDKMNINVTFHHPDWSGTESRLEKVDGLRKQVEHAQGLGKKGEVEVTVVTTSGAVKLALEVAAEDIGLGKLDTQRLRRIVGISPVFKDVLDPTPSGIRNDWENMLQDGSVKMLEIYPLKGDPLADPATALKGSRVSRYDGQKDPIVHHLQGIRRILGDRVEQIAGFATDSWE